VSISATSWSVSINSVCDICTSVPGEGVLLNNDDF
jgi:hypothetical protein